MIDKTHGKPTLVLDFDGVCHSYTSPWQGVGIIPDPPVDGLFEFLEEAKEQFEISIFSTRSADPAGLEAMQEWFRHWHKNWMEEEDGKPSGKLRLDFPIEKPPALVTLDDRGLTFTGVWPSVESLRTFKPWNR